MSYTANEDVWVPREATVSAEDTFTDPLNIKGPGYIRVTDTSSMSMTLSLQSSDDDGTSWITEDTFSAEGTYEIENGLGLAWRIGCASGDYTSGTADVKIARVED